MRPVQLLVIALALGRIASADIFTYTFNTGTQTATVTDKDISCTSPNECSGGLSTFACNVAFAPPTFCSLEYNREEYLGLTEPAPPGCGAPDYFRCPNDMTPLFGRVEVVDRAGRIEGLFVFEALSHSLVEDSVWYAPGPIPELPVNAIIVDNGSGQPQFLDTMTWTNGEVDTFDVAFVPDPSSAALVLTALVLCVILKRRAASPYATRRAWSR